MKNKIDNEEIIRRREKGSEFICGCGYLVLFPTGSANSGWN
jgi:hypothetical protein